MDSLLVFEQASGSTPGGLPVREAPANAPALAPTSLRVEQTRGAVLLVPPLAVEAPMRLVVETPSGLVELGRRADGAYVAGGKAAALEYLVKTAVFTAFMDSGRSFRLYPGQPKGVLHLAEGGCTRPFVARSGGASELVIEPAAACSTRLAVAPLASLVEPVIAESFHHHGPEALASRNLYLGSLLAPSRDSLLWEERTTRGRLRSSTVRISSSEDVALALLSSSSLLSGGLTSPNYPLYVFHASRDSVRSVLSLPRRALTREAAERRALVLLLDDAVVLPDTIYEPPCQVGVPTTPRRGRGPNAPGPHPARATLLVDFHGVAWTYYFDAHGLLLRVVNHGTGAVRSYNYDASGNLTGSEDPVGGRTCYRWDSNGNLVETLQLPAPDHIGPAAPIRLRTSYTGFPYRPKQVFDPRSNGTKPWATYHWDERGNLLGSTDAAGNETSVALVGGDGPDRAQPRSVVGPDGAVTEYHYDIVVGALERVVRDAAGPEPDEIELVHDPAGHLVWARTALGEIVTWDWQDGRLRSTTRMADGLFDFEEYGYDADGQITTVTAGDRTTSLAYDAIGNVASITETPMDGSALPRTTCISSGPDGRALEVVHPGGSRTRYHYDGEGRLTLVEAGQLPPSPQAWDDACPSPPPDVTAAAGTLFAAAYDPAGRPTEVRDALNVATRVRYDGFGRAAEAARSSLIVRTAHDALGLVEWTASYDASKVATTFGVPWPGQPGLLAAEELSHDVSGRLVQHDAWHFDELGQPVGDGKVTTRYVYDVPARRRFVTDDAGFTWRQAFDGLGRQVLSQLPNGAEIVTQFLNGGRTIVTQRPAPTPSGQVVQRLELTAWGAPTLAIAGDGQVMAPVQTWAYDNQRRISKAWSATGGGATFDFDAFGQLLRSERIYGDSSERIALSWDAGGRLREHRSDSGSILAKTQFYYDALGRARRRVGPEGRVTELAYQGASDSVALELDPAEYAHHYSYDAAGRLARIRTVAPGQSDVTQSRDFLYDPLGRLREAYHQEPPLWTQAETRTHLRWDSLGNKVREWTSGVGANGGVAHQYDGRSLPVSSNLVGLKVSRTFDEVARLVDVYVAQSSAPAAHFEWPLAGPPFQRRLSSGVDTTYRYDPFERLVQQSDATPNQLLAQLSWSIPVDGSPRAETFFGVGIPAGQSAFRADLAGRLLTEAHDVPGQPPGPLSSVADSQAANQWAATLLGQGGARRDYELDGRHNWAKLILNGASLTPTLGLDDAYLSFGQMTAEYDGRGAVLSDGERSYGYNSFGELTWVDGPQAGREYVRDALGRIVVERDTATGAETRIAYDGAARAAIIHPSGEVERFVPGLRLDEHLMRVLPDGSQQFFHQDRSGNTYLVTDGSAQPLEWYRYTAYGEASILSPAGVRLGASAIGNRLTYQGQLADHALGLVDMRARHYLPTWGRFLSRDPLGLLAGSNAYAFVDSSPLIYTDPLGLAKVGRGSDICVVSCHDQTPAPGLEGGWRLTHPADVLNRVWGAAVAAYQYAKGVERGMANGAMDAAVGLYTAVRHPIQTLEGIGHAVTHPRETLSLLWQATKSTGKAIFIDGDPDAAGRVLFEVGLTLFTAGAGHVSKADKAADLGRLADKGADASRAAGGRGGRGYFEMQTNSAGGRVYTSTGEIVQDDFARIVDGAVAQGDDVTILTGVHGMPDGRMYPDRWMFLDDLRDFGGRPGVKVLDVDTLEMSDIRKIMNGVGTIIGGFCHSGTCLPKPR